MALSREISVVIPVYNRAPMVVQAIDSVLSQPGFTWQILVVDDGSTDDSSAAVQHLANAGKPVTLIRHDRNRGVSAARNTALRLVSKPLVGFLDSDDLMVQGSYEALWHILNAQPEIDISHGLREDIPMSAGSAAFARSLTLPASTLCLSGLLVRAQLVRATGFFDEDLRRAEDIEWFHRIPDIKARVGLHPQVTLQRRIGADNLTEDLEGLRRARLAWVRKHRQREDQ
jgi:glycosyltransferase involved in cell wall biosynthesis